MSKPQFSKQKAILLVTAFIDVIGIGIVIPTLPSYVERLSDSAFLASSFFAIYSFFAFFATPVLGSLSDKYGRRPILLASLLGTAIGWFVFAWGGSVILLVLGRVIDGITSGNISTAMNYLSDIAKDAKERAANLGMIGAVFGIGFIIGPALGAVLTNVSPAFPFWIAGFMALANTIAAYFFLPESLHEHKRNAELTLNPLRGIGVAFRTKPIRNLLWVWTFFALAVSALPAIFALYVDRAFALGPEGIGFLFAGMGLLIAVNQGVLMKKFWLRRFSEHRLILLSIAFMFLSFAAMATGLFSLFLLALVLSAFGQSNLRVVNNSAIIGHSPASQQGMINGVVQSVFFLSSIVAPLYAGGLMEVNLHLPWILAAFFMVVAFFFALRPVPEIPKEEAPARAAGV